MVKYIKYKGGSGQVHKVSEEEYKKLKEAGERLEIVDSVVRKKNNVSPFGKFMTKW